MVTATSFSASRVAGTWGGLSLRWYREVLADRSLWESVRNSVVVAVVSTAASTLLGTLAALAIGRRDFRGRGLLGQLLNAPILLPEIVLGIALLSTYALVGANLGLGTVVCGHVTLGFPVVALVVLGRVRSLDPDVERAALDLGATPSRAFRDVVLPALAPGILSGALVAFTVSIDDFVVTFFTAGAGASTLPLKVWALMRHGTTPAVNAAAALLVAATALFLAAARALSAAERVPARAKWAFAAGAPSLLLLALLPPLGGTVREVRLLVYSDYFVPALAAEFEKETGVRVRVDYTNTNEETLVKVKLGAGGHDLVIASSFLLELLAREGLLQPIEAGSVPNLSRLDPVFRGPPWDPSGRWGIPLAYGFTGIAWNSSAVAGPVESWKVLWDPAYRGRILMLDDAREVFTVAYSLFGVPLDAEHADRLPEALELLASQKPFLRKYESNLAGDLLVRGEVDLAQTWAGQAWRAARERPQIRFCLPKEGSLLFVDSLCIPRGASRPAEAALLSDFLLRPENASRWMQETGYSMPYPDAVRLLPREMRENPVFIPPVGRIGDHRVGVDLGELAPVLDHAWTQLKSR